jgi:hypothetical protein
MNSVTKDFNTRVERCMMKRLCGWARELCGNLASINIHDGSTHELMIFLTLPTSNVSKTLSKNGDGSTLTLDDGPILETWHFALAIPVLRTPEDTVGEVHVPVQHTVVLNKSNSRNSYCNLVVVVPP